MAGNQNMPEKQSLRNVVYAIMTDDSETETTYDTPKPLIGAISAKISPSTESESLDADDIVFDNSTGLGDIGVEFELALLPLAVQADLLGHTYQDGHLLRSSDDEAPYVALGYLSQPQANGYELTWLYKGKFEVPSRELKTKTKKPEYRKPTIKGTFIARKSDHYWEHTVDGATATPELAKTWFASVQQPPQRSVMG